MNRRKFNDHEADCQCPICTANTESMQWKKDVHRDRAELIITDLNCNCADGSYVIGEPKSGEDDEVGIYFVNPAEVLRNIKI